MFNNLVVFPHNDSWYLRFYNEIHVCQLSLVKPEVEKITILTLFWGSILLFHAYMGGYGI